MPRLFISDLHLDAARPRTVEAFERFLAAEARSTQALYILGDLFESWIGDDDDSDLARDVARKLRAVSDSGVPIFFMHGNRDFLLGEAYAARSGMTLLADPTVIELAGERTLLMHGDTLCTDDVGYQKFRTLVRDPQWQRDFLAKPLAARRAFAEHARGESRAQTAMKASDIMDVNQDAVESAMRHHQVQRLIHGHTHRPATHRFRLDGRDAVRIVLPAWDDRSEALGV